MLFDDGKGAGTIHSIYSLVTFSSLLIITKKNRIYTRTRIFLASCLEAFGKLKIHAPDTCEDHLAAHGNAACSEPASVLQCRAMAWRSSGQDPKTNDIASGAAGGILSSQNTRSRWEKLSSQKGLLYAKSSGFLHDPKCLKPGTDDCQI